MTIVIDTPLRQTMPGVGWMHGLADIAGSQCGHGAFAVLIVISSNQIEAQHHLAKRKRKSEENRRNIKEEAKETQKLTSSEMVHPQQAK